MDFITIKITTQDMYKYRPTIESSIDPERMAKINLLQRREDRDRAIVGELLSRTAVCRMFGLKNRELAILISPYGKPYVREDRNIAFNISHAGSWVVCGVGRGRIGVDVEKIREMDFGFAERYFTSHELILLRESDSETRKRLYCSIWTLKESYIKAVGKGLFIPLESFSIRIRPGGIRAVSDGRDSGFRFKLFQNMDPEFSFAMCSENPPPESALVWTLADLVGEIRRHS